MSAPEDVRHVEVTEGDRVRERMDDVSVRSAGSTTFLDGTVRHD